MLFWTIWWVWLCFALVLAILEVAVSGFIFLGFALGAVVLGLGLLVVPGLFVGISLNALLALYAGLALASWIFLRFAFRRQSSGAETFTNDIND